MASGKKFLEYVLEQLSGTDGIRWRPMMGEYLLYCRGTLVGGIYDDRLLVKPTPSARALLPEAPLALPYEGAKDMLLVDEIDNRTFLNELLNAMVDELPAPKKKG